MPGSKAERPELVQIDIGPSINPMHKAKYVERPDGSQVPGIVTRGMQAGMNGRPPDSEGWKNEEYSAWPICNKSVKTPILALRDFRWKEYPVKKGQAKSKAKGYWIRA